MAFFIQNTMTRKKEKLSPIDGKTIRMYTCGPTVYNYAHIGNFRAYVFEDLLRRYIKFSGFNVIQVQNLTDVDDKTIKGSIKQGKALKDYTKTYIDAFFKDLKILNIEPAEHYPAATDYIPKMIEMIQKLIELDYAYSTEDGSVYYRIKKFDNYGDLAKLDLSGMKSNIRITNDEYEKDNMGDFALWKAYSSEDGDVFWKSPWGKGRPGWHIECSAMSTSILGESFDLHCGGVDNICPHHENEIAQSEAISGKTYSRYWMHCGYLIVNGKKMSKSEGNFYTLNQLLERGYSGREIRYELISTHYRQALNFTFNSLDANRASLKRLDEFYSKLLEISRNSKSNNLPSWAQQTKEKFTEYMDDDMNISGALSSIFDMVHEGNIQLNNNNVSSSDAAAVIEFWHNIDSVLGFMVPSKEDIPENILDLCDKRALARKEKRWNDSDSIRDQIFEFGYAIKDEKDGYKLRKL